MLKKISEIQSPRKAYGETLVELGKKNKNIVVLDADLACSTQTCMFEKEFPERFFDAGIAEQDMMTTAVGLSLTGKIAFVSTFAMFASARCLDQVRNSICYQKANVKIVATHGGITVGEDGASHQALEDVAFMRNLPNMTVIVPADYTEVKQAIKYASETDGPFYIRIARGNIQTIFDEKEYKFNPDKSVTIKEGSDLTIITNGEELLETIKCAELLEKDGIEAQIIHIPVVKPLPNDIIQKIEKTPLIVTVENHSIIGGLGSAICELTAENKPVKVLRIGTNDVFGQSGEQRTLMEYYELTAEKIYKKIKGILS